jgi:hypothetical protein
MHAITKKQTGRRCKCGYVFARLANRRRQFASFAVVSDQNYQRFLRAEVRVLRAADGPAQLRAIARSAKYVGSLLECPDCGRLLFASPGGDSEAFYVRE